jgi:hypothetical protein
MSSKERYCRQCGERFTYTRDDQQFCSPACVAKFYRENPNPQYIHAANMDEYWHKCEYCGTEFFVNGYAERGGKRAPKYCSRACKQAAYRARGETPQDQAARRGEADNGSAPRPNSRKSKRAAGSASGAPPDQQRSTPPPPPPPPAQGKQAPAPKWKYVGSSRYDSKAVAEARGILGVDANAPAAVRKKAYMKLIRFWHPDTNTSPHATAWAQAINWAFDYLKGV